MADQFNRSGGKQQLLKRCSPPAVSPESIEGRIAKNYAIGFPAPRDRRPPDASYAK